MLEIVGISKKFKSTTALENINLDFNDKGLVAILGESGSGKSTLFNILTGIIKPDEGQVVYDGKILNSDGKINSDNVFGIVFQDGNLFGGLTVKENLDICSTDSQRQKEILQSLGIQKYIDTKVSKLSGGEMQRVAIARALLDDSNVLLADEPTGSLDEKNGENVMAILKDISALKLVLVITHNVELAYKYADRIIEISRGKVQNDRKNSPYISLQEDRQLLPNEVVAGDCPNDTAEKRRDMSMLSVNKFCLSKLKSTFSKSITSIIILSFILALIALSSAFLMADCQKEYIEFIKKYEYSELYNDKDMYVFAQKLQGGDMSGLTRYYHFGWTEGLCGNLIIDDTLNDDEIKLGNFTAKALEEKMHDSLEEGDIVDYHGCNFTIKEIKDSIDSSEEVDLNSAVYLNGKIAREIMLKQDMKFEFSKINRQITVIRDDSVRDGYCTLNFGFYYNLGMKDPSYIDLKNNTLDLKFYNGVTLLYKKSYIIKNVDSSSSDISECIIYVSPDDYEMIKESGLFYGYLIKTDDDSAIEYWLKKDVEIYNNGFDQYQYAQKVKNTLCPYVCVLLIIGAMLSVLYILSVFNHIGSTNRRELYILKTLRVSDKNIFLLLLIQAIPIILCANLATLFINIFVRILIKRNIAFLALQVAGSNLILLAVSVIFAVLIALLKTVILNKNFNINMTR